MLVYIETTVLLIILMGCFDYEIMREILNFSFRWFFTTPWQNWPQLLNHSLNETFLVEFYKLYHLRVLAGF